MSEEVFGTVLRRVKVNALNLNEKLRQGGLCSQKLYLRSSKKVLGKTSAAVKSKRASPSLSVKKA